MGVVEIVCYVSMRKFQGRIVLSNKIFFSRFSKIEQNFWSILLTIFWRGCQNCILRFHRNLQRKQFLLEKSSFIDFQQRAKKVRTSGNSFHLGCETCILRVHRDNFREEMFFFNFLFFSKYFRTMS